MSDFDTVRAWKDPKYRRSLSPALLAKLPQHPAGLVELSDDELRIASGAGASKPAPQTTAMTCTQYSFLNWKACGCGPMTTAITCTQWSARGWKACCP